MEVLSTMYNCKCTTFPHWVSVDNVINYSNYSDDSIAYVHNFAYETKELRARCIVLAIVENQIELYTCISFICMTQPATF